MQSKLKVSIPLNNRLRQRINEKREETEQHEELRNKAIALPSIPPIQPKRFNNSNFADRVSRNGRSLKRDTNQFSLQVSPIQPKVTRKSQISNLWPEKITASIISKRYSPSADVEIEQISAPMISKDDSLPGTPAKSKTQTILPNDVNYRWIGSGLNFRIVLRKSWLQSQGIADDATSVNKKAILKATLTELKKVVKWLQDADIAAIMKLNFQIDLGGKLKDKKEIFSLPLRDEILALIGAPEGQEVTVSIRSNSIAVRLDKRLILRHAKSGKTQILQNKKFNEILFSNIETATGLSLEKRTEAINDFYLPFDGPVKNIPKAYILSLNDELLQYIFGEAWSEFRQTPRKAAGEVQGQTINLPTGIEEKDQQKILEILKQILPPGDTKEPKQAKPGSLSLSKDAVKFLLEIANSPKKEKEQILEVLKEAKKGTKSKQTLEQVLETAIAQAKMKEAYKRLDMNFTAPRSQPPVENRPVRGHIMHREPHIIPQKEVAFTFQVEDKRDAFRAPLIRIHWFAHAKDPKSPKSPRFKGIMVSGLDIPWQETERNVYSPLKDSGFVNDKFFEVKFPSSGIYVVEAIVDHNFFLPNHFKIEVEVRSEKETVSLLEKEALKGFVQEGSGKEKKYDFDVGSVTGLVTDYEEGTITRGEIDPKFKGETVKQRLKAIDDEKKRIKALLKTYKGKRTSDAYAIREWATHYLKKLSQGRRRIAKEATAPGTFNVPCQGTYVSRTKGVPSANLNILCLLKKTKDNKYQVILHDISQVYENDNYRVSETADSAEDSAEAVMEKAFVEHATNYPEGTMSLTFQKWDEATQALSKEYVKFTKVTDTLGKDIKGVLFSGPVNIAVNIVSAVLTLFPPTTAVGLSLGIAYNGAQTIAELEEAYAKGTLTSKKVKYAAGTIALDLLPFVGKSNRVITLGRKTFIAIEATQLGGQAYLITQQGLDKIANIRNGVVSKLAKVEAEIEQIKKYNPADPRLSELGEKRKELIQEGRDASVEVFSKLITQQAVMIVGGAILQEMATRKFKVSVDELKKNGLFEDTKGKKLEYDYNKKKIVGDEKKFTPAQLQKVQKVAYYDQSLTKAIPDVATRKKVIEVLGDHEIEVRSSASKTRLEKEGDKLVLHVADNAKPGDILAEAYRVKSKTPVTSVEPGKTRTPVEQAQYHKNDLIHLEELRKQASKETTLDEFAIDQKIRGKFLEMERVVNAMPEGTKKKAQLQKWLDNYRKKTYEPATKLFDRLKTAKSNFPARYAQFKPEHRAKILGMKDEGLAAFARLAPDQQDKLVFTGII